MTNEFTREARYAVLKSADVMQCLTVSELIELRRIQAKVEEHRAEIRKPPLDCVVVESDWPEFEPTWEAIKSRVTGAQSAPDDEYVGWYCAHCQRGVDASEVTYYEQHKACGRVITDDRPPKPAPNMPVDVITDYLVSISAHIAHQDDAKAQAEISELLKLLTANPSKANTTGI